MSIQDPLLRAIEALRAETPDFTPRSQETEDAIVRQLTIERSQRIGGRSRSIVLVPLAAILFGSSACAIVSPQSPLRELFPAPFAATKAPPEQTQPTHPAAPRARAQERAPEPPAGEAEILPELPSSQEERVSVRKLATTRSNAPATPSMNDRHAEREEPVSSSFPERGSENGTPPPARDPSPADQTAAELALYQLAHRAQFHAKDFGAALAGWDAYLSAYPTGTLSLEARYHRALCLFVLGRPGARRALEPFARGDYGDYRRVDAERMIQQLDRRTGPAPGGPP